MTMQGIKVDGFWLTVIAIGVALLGTAFGLAHTEPIGCPVAGAFKPADVNKGFGQVNRVTIDFFPVST